MTTVASIITRAGRILFDVGNVRWTTSELTDYVTDAQRQIVFYRPDAFSVTESVALTANQSKQTLPPEASRLLRVIRNMGANGTTPGRAIREASRLALDAENPDWHTRTGAYVEHYVFDNQSPKTFYIYPTVTAAHQIEVVYAKTPGTVGTNIDLGDEYVNAILDWVLYRCFLKDAVYAGNPARAQMHLQSFANDLGINLKASFTAAMAGGNDPPVKTNMQSVNDHGAR